MVTNAFSERKTSFLLLVPKGIFPPFTIKAPEVNAAPPLLSEELFSILPFSRVKEPWLYMPPPLEEAWFDSMLVSNIVTLALFSM